MTLDDLMEVWRAQDASPLVDKSLLHLALRREQANLEKQRRRARRGMYALCAFFLAGMGVFLAIMNSPQGDGVRNVWDYVVAGVGAAAALVLAREVYVTYRAQAALDRRFGESLRDQLARHIAQLDDDASRNVRLAMVIVAAATVWAKASEFAGRRINDLPHSEDWLMRGLIFLAVCFVFFTWLHRAEQREILPRKRELEALLKELDSQ